MASPGVNNTMIVIGIFSIFSFIFLMMGFIGASFQSQNTNVVGGNTSISVAPTTNPITIFDFIGLFFSGLFFSINALPVWGNLMLFGSSALGLAYIIASFVRGTSG